MRILPPVSGSAQEIVRTPPAPLEQSDACSSWAPKADELRDWQQEGYDLDERAAVPLGFAVGQASVSTRRRVLIFKSSRSKDITTSVCICRFGVALRVVVEVDGMKSDGDLTLPVVAGKVELEGAWATSHLSIKGYRGDDLGPLLPRWTSFGVEQYSGYMETCGLLHEYQQAA